MEAGYHLFRVSYLNVCQLQICKIIHMCIHIYVYQIKITCMPFSVEHGWARAMSVCQCQCESDVILVDLCLYLYFYLVYLCVSV